MAHEIVEYNTRKLYELTSPERGGILGRLTRLVLGKKYSSKDLLIHVRKCLSKIEPELENSYTNPLLVPTYQGLKQVEEFILLTGGDVTLIRKLLAEKLALEASLVSGIVDEKSKISESGPKLRTPFFLHDFTTSHDVQILGPIFDYGEIYNLRAPNLTIEEACAITLRESEISGEVYVDSLKDFLLERVRATRVRIGESVNNISINGQCDIEELIISRNHHWNESIMGVEDSNVTLLPNQRGKNCGIKKITFMNS